MSDPDLSHSRLRRRLVLLALQAGIVIVGLLLLEVGSRGYLWIRGKPYDAEETLRQAQDLPRVNREFLPKEAQEEAEADPASAEAIALHPYLGWEVNTGFDSIDGANRALHSSADFGALKIFVVGGSVAAACCVADASDGVLRSVLAADQGIQKRRSMVLNLARGGYKEPQQIDFIVYLLSLGFKPDVVINIDGFNEVALGSNNAFEGSHPVFPSAAHWSNLLAQGANDDVALDMMGEIREKQRAIERWSERFARWHLERSCLAGTLTLKRMFKLRGEVVSRFEAYARHLGGRKELLRMHGPRFTGGDEATIDACVRIWKESSRSLNDICRERGIAYIHVLQPTLHDTGSKPVTAREIEHGWMAKAWMRGVKLGYPKLREQGQDLRRMGVDFIDASLLFENHPEDLYYDACHFVHAGHVLLAEVIGHAISRRLAEKR